MVKVYALAVPLLCLLACSRGSIDTKEAVRQGVIDHLAGQKDLNISSMNVDVASVTFKENEADALVSFAPKGSGGAPVTIPYTLERKGDRWVVKPRAPGQNPHGAGREGHMPQPGEMPADGALPPGHPAVPQK